MTIEGLIATRRVEHDNPAFWYVLGYEGEFFIIVHFNEALDKDDLAFFLSCDFRSLHLGREPYEPAPRTANCVHIGFPIFAFPTASLLLGNKASVSLLTDPAT